MAEEHKQVKQGIVCPQEGNLTIEEWQGIGWVYSTGITNTIVKDGKCPECGQGISYLLVSRGEPIDENLALDVLSTSEIEDSNGC